MGSTPQGVIAAGIILPTLGSIALVLRFYGRRIRNTTIQRDDWMMVVGLVCYLLKPQKREDDHHLTYPCAVSYLGFGHYHDRR